MINMDNNTIKIVIVDDEQYSRSELRYLLQDYAFISEIKEADSCDAGLKLVSGFCPDIVFIDIKMGIKSGFDMADALRTMAQNPLIIFATAHDEFALHSYEYDACDYILKPFNESRLNITISRAIQRLNRKYSKGRLDKISIPKEGGLVYVEINDILFITRENRVTQIKTRTNMFHSRTTIREYEQKLTGYGFYRAHNSYLVNIEYAEELQEWFNGAYKLKLRHHDKTIPVARGYAKNFKLI